MIRTILFTLFALASPVTVQAFERIAEKKRVHHIYFRHIPDQSPLRHDAHGFGLG